MTLNDEDRELLINNYLEKSRNENSHSSIR
jgi:hypothetical protein